ncbi:hypothetical protein O6H91_20G031200 [Diphasiastrum complanatum]|uniref:Uncharacterized protein n=1 Tax=Diphasiastrum complanatum TaxID=34168 RepID=A0ACC2AP99_DIPCM|nr:hypothetical protein O6H91_20G031200 [Diphasiastrum complanatum]
MGWLLHCLLFPLHVQQSFVAFLILMAFRLTTSTLLREDLGYESATRRSLRPWRGHLILMHNRLGASLILRWAFKENATLAIGSVEGENAIDRGFEALRLFNLLKSIHERGVIYGWDATRMISHDSIAKSACSELPG